MADDPNPEHTITVLRQHRDMFFNALTTVEIEKAALVAEVAALKAELTALKAESAEVKAEIKGE